MNKKHKAKLPVIPNNPLPKRYRVRTPPSRHIRRSNHLLSLALVVLVVGAVTTAGVHNLSSSNAATGPKGASSSDVTAPTVGFTAPAASSVTGKSVLVTVAASDEAGGSGMASVAVYLDGDTTALKTFSGAGPYSFTWDTSAVSIGSHTLSAVATDKAGNNSTSLLTVTVY